MFDNQRSYQRDCQLCKENTEPWITRGVFVFPTYRWFTHCLSYPRLPIYFALLSKYRTSLVINTHCQFRNYAQTNLFQYTVAKIAYRTHSFYLGHAILCILLTPGRWVQLHWQTIDESVYYLVSDMLATNLTITHHAKWLQVQRPKH